MGDRYLADELPRARTKVEHMVLREILDHARAGGAHKLSGTYRPTDRNKLVIDHYEKLGFTKVEEDASGLTRWELSVEGAPPESAPMKVVSQGFREAKEKLDCMSQSNAIAPEDKQEERLPRRDLIILPLLSLLTLTVCLLAANAVARHFFLSVRDDSCEIGDPMIGFRFGRNCTEHAKTAEGPWVAHQFNDCGYRTRESCGPKRPGTTRISLLGASAAEGYLVPYDETFAARTAKQLTLELGRPVEIQNLGREQCYPDCVLRRIDEALALKPDLLLVAVTPIDLDHMDPSEVTNPDKPMQAVDQVQLRHKLDPHNPLNGAQDFVMHSSAGVATLHFLFQNPATFVRMYLLSGEHAAYLRPNLSPTWDSRLEACDLLFDEMSKKAREANVPIALVEVPSLAQASLVSMNTVPSGLDPYVIDERLRQIAERHGIQFIDVLDVFEHGLGPNKLFYVVDGHMNGEGSELVANALAEQLIEGQKAALLGQNDAQQRIAPEHGR